MEIKRLFVIVLLLLVFNTAFSQNDYYSGKTKVIGNDYTYNVIEHDAFIELHETANELSGSEWFFRDGVTYGDSRMTGFVKPKDAEAIYSIFKKLFIQEEISAIKQGAQGNFCAINAVMVVDETGKVLEVDFNFPKIPVLVNIPPSKFYELSKKIKETLAMNYPDSVKKWCTYVKGVNCYINLRNL